MTTITLLLYVNDTLSLHIKHTQINSLMQANTDTNTPINKTNDVKSTHYMAH